MKRFGVLTGVCFFLLSAALPSRASAAPATMTFAQRPEISAFSTDGNRFSPFFGPNQLQAQFREIACAVRNVVMGCVVGRTDPVPVEHAVLVAEGQRLPRDKNIGAIFALTPTITVLATLTGYNRVGHILSNPESERALKLGKDSQVILVAGVPPRGAVGSATFGNKIKLGEQIIVALGARAIIGTTTGSSSSSTPITYRAIMAPGGAGVVVTNFGIFKTENLRPDAARILVEAPGIMLVDPKMSALGDEDNVLD